MFTAYCINITLSVAAQRDIRFYNSHSPQLVLMAGMRGATNPLLQTSSRSSSWLRSRTNLLPLTKIWASYNSNLADTGGRAV